MLNDKLYFIHKYLPTSIENVIPSASMIVE